MKRGMLILAVATLALSGCAAAPDAAPVVSQAAAPSEEAPREGEAPAVGECFPESDTEEYYGQPWFVTVPIDHQFSVDPVCWTTADGGIPMSALWWGDDAVTAEAEARAALADLPEPSPGVFVRTTVMFRLTETADSFRLDIKFADDEG